MEKQDNNYKQIEDNIIHTLKDIKQSYIKMKEQLDVSIRKDVVAVELKDILINNDDISAFIVLFLILIVLSLVSIKSDIPIIKTNTDIIMFFLSNFNFCFFIMTFIPPSNNPINKNTICSEYFGHSLSI